MLLLTRIVNYKCHALCRGGVLYAVYAHIQPILISVSIKQ